MPHGRLAEDLETFSLKLGHVDLRWRRSDAFPKKKN